MFPRISDLINAATGLNVWLPFQTYGFFLGMAVVTAVLVTGRRLDRLQSEGAFAPPASAVVPEKRRRKKRRRKHEPPGQRDEPPKASDLMPLVFIVAMVLGIAGSRVFSILDDPAAFAADPWRAFSRSGLSFYGGFLLAAPAVVWVVHRAGVPIGLFIDAAAPTVLLAYGIARIGCQLSGDGDWGIPADMSLKPDWLPVWLWAETYPGNVEGIAIPPPGVYPTPIYEIVLSWGFAALLFALPVRAFAPGWLFSLMVVLMAIERLAIERIRVNPRFDLFGFHPTQAEVLSLLLLVSGGVALSARLARTARSAIPDDR